MNIILNVEFPRKKLMNCRWTNFYHWTLSIPLNVEFSLQFEFFWMLNFCWTLKFKIERSIIEHWNSVENENSTWILNIEYSILKYWKTFSRCSSVTDWILFNMCFGYRVIFITKKILILMIKTNAKHWQLFPVKFE